MRLARWTLRAVAAVVGAFALASPAAAQEPTLDTVSITGDPVVGSPLQAVIAGTVDPSAVTYRWCHQRDGLDGRCATGRPIGTSATYVPTASDVGYPLLVKATATIATFDVEVTSAPTLPVAATPPPPGTSPPPDTTTAPPPPAFTSSGTSSNAPTEPAPGSVPTRLSYLDPFPVLRIRGVVTTRGARIELLRVTAPRGARVRVRCAGNGCPFARRSRRAGRIRALERFLRAGVRITVRIQSPRHVGKYVRVVIRAGKPPARRDACVLPGRRRAVSCPPV
jgi:hypothetical protein